MTERSRPLGVADHSISQPLARKLNGAFYTPESLASVLANWAVARQPRRFLDPSYGDGVFLRAAKQALETSGVQNAVQRLVGVEIDAQGPRRLVQSGLTLPASQLHCGDLLELEVDQLGGPFDAIAGNPPYIRHHLLSNDLIRNGRTSAKRAGIALNGRADAWAYFCAHLVQFLTENGRLALVLPGSVLQADYAEPVLAGLASGRGAAQLIRLRERVFTQVQERTVILLLDRTAPGDGELIPRQLASVAELSRALRSNRPARSRRQPKRTPSSVQRDERGGLRNSRLPWRLTRREAELFERTQHVAGVHRFGELATVRIGVVTGANPFFVRTADEMRQLGVLSASVPVVSSGRWLKAPCWRAEDQRAVGDKPSRLLVVTGDSNLTPELQVEIDQAEDARVNLRSHCARRSPWYSLREWSAPQLFLPYMGSHAPRLVVNTATATCTNAVHRIWLRARSASSSRALAAGSWTTLWALSAEVAGRTYGGGVLKLEPRDAARLVVPVLPTVGPFHQIADAYQQDGALAARELADDILLVGGLGLTRAEVARMRGALDRLQELRSA